MSRVVEVEWKNLLVFFGGGGGGGGGAFKKMPHLTDLKSSLVHVDARFKHENAAVFKIRC